MKIIKRTLAVLLAALMLALPAGAEMIFEGKVTAGEAATAVAP